MRNGRQVIAAQHGFRLAIIGGGIQQSDTGARRQLQDEFHFRARHLAMRVGNAIGLAELDRADPQPADDSRAPLRKQDAVLSKDIRRAPSFRAHA